METTAPLPAQQIWRRLAWIGVYAAAMGILEAICVIYLRRIFPVETNFPIPPMDRMQIEVIREACTIVMLVAVAWLGGINASSRVACFFYAFGIWDILYYVGLKWLSDWPDSLLTWDCLFLIPKPWYGPVLAPVLISAYFAAACMALHARPVPRIAPRILPAVVLLQLLAGAVWYWSFVKDADHITANGYDAVRYGWEWFALGMTVACTGLWVAARPQPAPGAP